MLLFGPNPEGALRTRKRRRRLNRSRPGVLTVRRHGPFQSGSVKMFDGSDEKRLTMAMRWCYPLLLAMLAFAIGGCATTVGLGQTALREGRYIDAARSFETALKEHPERTDALVGLVPAGGEAGSAHHR